MKKTLIILALALTSSMANIDSTSIMPNSKHINKEKIPELTREVPTTRSSRESRKVRKARNITTRASRKIRHLPIQDRLIIR